MDSYTLEEARIIIHTEEIKERNKKRRAVREFLKHKLYGIALITIVIIEPIIIGPDPVTGMPDITFSVVVAIGGLFYIFDKRINYIRRK